MLKNVNGWRVIGRRAERRLEIAAGACAWRRLFLWLGG
ncbi:Uncharacterized protein ChrSV_2544 [Chromobacterium vaccinii]|nr:Uncharacterized protein ChrSW_2544 [Chromobacterium vaccinii]QND90001.1 Uncharacterized protein ChrSV_2544 [Chromobacterium vaccinii]